MRLSGEEERKGVNRIIKLVLSKDVFKKPVSRSEISSALKGEGVPTSGATVNSLIELAKGKLKHVFGFELADGSKDSLYCGEVQSQMTQVTSRARPSCGPRMSNGVARDDLGSVRLFQRPARPEIHVWVRVPRVDSRVSSLLRPPRSRAGKRRSIFCSTP